MSDTLYDDDILAWSEQQAALLGRAAAGERVNGLDWPNLIEEIDGVGRSQLSACEGLLLQALRHLLKIAGWPESRAVGHLRGEVLAFLPQASAAFSPSMRQRIDLARIYRQALKAATQERIDDRDAAALPQSCPLSLDDLLSPDPDLDALLANLTAG